MVTPPSTTPRTKPSTSTAAWPLTLSSVFRPRAGSTRFTTRQANGPCCLFARHALVHWATFLKRDISIRRWRPRITCCYLAGKLRRTWKKVDRNFRSRRPPSTSIGAACGSTWSTTAATNSGSSDRRRSSQSDRRRQLQTKMKSLSSEDSSDR